MFGMRADFETSEITNLRLFFRVLVRIFQVYRLFDRRSRHHDST